ncbi:hypothetical protein [Halarcobacter ebronensis]|uniref:Uncharacterized protein n=1 Tax=Halarcobacter ebronensis TaxID=1462615 RepID=A0A4Q1ANB1_9BACT|nr:hypothetical protein [Halarcobacter ebronensis]QKF82167.1 hypothetical protein AEBR_1684 [Halarcobacter ebronensis]RXK03454.1 hypothetical protein CRV07_12295 [Halarcobacter ebronensis]
MIRNYKNYFSFFGILCATVNKQLHSNESKILALLKVDIPKIIKLLLSKQLKPIKLYSTNNN